MSPKLASQWTRIAGWTLIGFAALQFTRCIPGISAPGDLLADMFKWPIDDDPGTPSQEAAFMVGICAGLTAALGALFALLLAPLLAEGDARAKRAGLWAIALWFFMDVAASLFTGIPQNIIFSVLFLLFLGLPLALADLKRRS